MKMLKIFVASLMFFSLNSFADELSDISVKKLSNSNISIPTPSKVKDTSLSNPTNASKVVSQAPRADKAKELTVMVFINAKNNLEGAGLYNVNDMERVGSTDKVNIIAEFGRMNGQDGDVHDDGDWIGLRRYYITKDTDTKVVKSSVVFKKEGTGAYDMGDFKSAIDFVKWTKQNYPAKRYMLVLWDHGTGWLDPKREQAAESSTTKGISFDDETGNYIATDEIGKIVKEVGGVDILAYDACLMQMAEVLDEVKDYTKVVIGSEETVPGIGYPYSLFLDAITKNPTMSNEDIGRVVVSSFKQLYTYVKQPATLSAVRSDKVKKFNSLMSDFATAAMAADEIDALKKAKNDVMRFDILGEQTDPQKKLSFFGDVYNFADIVSTSISKNDEKSLNLRMKAEALKSFIKKDLVIATGSYGKDRAGRSMDLSYGVSVYLPPVDSRLTLDKIDGILQEPYSKFKFNADTKWFDFVKYLNDKTK
ncbi:MAG: hypothetical protein KA059_08965 [Elusimicrobiales bacterium]|jgi:hypothetical protein|nr:hypothetical protein [Elusimicrobiales bacterium]